MVFISYLINGISLGSVYAIIALGYTMVYGIAKMLNFAHGDVIMVGAYVSFCATQYWGLPPAVSILAAMLLCTVLGVVIEGLAYKPLRSAPKLLFSIGSVGNSLGLAMVQYAILQCEMGADPAPLDLNFILLPYDQERAARDAENVLGMPMREAYLQEIRTGIYGRKPPLSKGKTE